MINAKSCKLNLSGMVGNGNVFYDPVVQGAVILEFQGTETVGNTFQSILNRMRKIIHGIDTPLITLAVMMHMADSVNYRVTHVEITGGKIDLSTEGILVILKFTRPHPRK